MPKTIETVPNISEGRRKEVLQEILSAVASEPGGARVLDLSSDADHNRSVLTLAGEPEQVRRSVLRLFEIVLSRIDLRSHAGEHPRMGAVDVVPFIPVSGATMDECVQLAREVGDEVARRFSLPIYLYEEAATSEHRRNLAEVRKGQFEGLGKKMQEARWKPDFGPTEPHPSAGATAIGAREFLIAFNVNLGTPRLEIAEKIARAIRHSSGGLRYCKAMGVALKERGLAQVSINMTNFRKTPLHRVVEMIRSEASRHGVEVVGSEIVGLVPNDALLAAADFYLRLESFDPTQVLENRLSNPGE
ncbi:MAG TPA: glutamate formimidoyltransferase [Candidatus Polarisedimenticolia bacterium]|nr:glutamate formimidoyltransferase [Candidatus Polarisedimenticolia bacterium]